MENGPPVIIGDSVTFNFKCLIYIYGKSFVNPKKGVNL